jgi:hypothetical protein
MTTHSLDLYSVFMLRRVLAATLHRSVLRPHPRFPRHVLPRESVFSPASIRAESAKVRAGCLRRDVEGGGAIWLMSHIIASVGRSWCDLFALFRVRIGKDHWFLQIQLNVGGTLLRRDRAPANQGSGRSVFGVHSRLLPRH